MGQLMDFYAGDATRIGEAFARRDHETLKNPEAVVMHADFSLHVTSIDLDILTELAAGLAGTGPTSFEDSWQQRLSGDGNESSAELMSREWVELMGRSDVSVLAPAWAAALAEEYSDFSLTVTDDMRHGLEALTALCREAARRGVSVVHTWSL